MPAYFASDMHLRLDRPERADRLARWVDGLDPGDALYLVGDVCDFWFAARQLPGDPLACLGLRALAGFRSRGGALTILPGNHDHWLGPVYEEVLGASFVQGPLVVEAHGTRLSLSHGHRAGGRRPWKAGMESRAFLNAFRRLPASVADRLDAKLERSNERGRVADEARYVEIFRRCLVAVDPTADIAVFGHVHTPRDDPSTQPRMVILGGWHTGTSYLRVDAQGATLVVEPATTPARLDGARRGV